MLPDRGSCLRRALCLWRGCRYGPIKDEQRRYEHGRMYVQCVCCGEWSEP